MKLTDDFSRAASASTGFLAIAQSCRRSRFFVNKMEIEASRRSSKGGLTVRIPTRCTVYGLPIVAEGLFLQCRLYVMHK